MKLRPIYSAARLSLPLATALVALFNLTTQSASAVSLFWDGNDVTAGAGTAPSGTWGTDLFWSTSSTGVLATTNATTTRVDDLFFSAGTDAINPFVVTVNGSQNARLLTFQEGAVTLSGGTLITLAGGGGITLGVGVALGGVTVSTALTLNGNNNFNNTSIRTLTLDTGAFTRSAGSTLNVQGTVDSTMTGLNANTNNIFGPWASFGTAAATTYAKYPVSGSTIAGLGYAGGVDGESAAASTDVVTGAGNLNYTTAATSGNLGLDASINTLRYTGGIGTLGTDTSFTTLGIMNSGTGLLTFSGAVASATELVVNTASSDITFGGILTGTITKTGSGTMTLGSAGHSIGGITVNQGTLVTNNSTDNSLPAVTINSGGTLRLGASNKFADNALLTINAGGILNTFGLSDTVGGLTGSGVITNSSTAGGTLSLTGVGQTFSGNLGDGKGIFIQVRNGGDQTLTSLNTYTRGTSIGGAGTAGTLRINSIADVGTTNLSAIGAPNTTTNAIIPIGSVAANGTLVYTGTGHSTNRQIRIGGNSVPPSVGDIGGAIIQADGASNNTLTFSNPTFNTQTNATSGTGANRTLTLQGASTGINTISGIIQNNLVTSPATGTATVGVTKAQAGTWVLSGLNTYSGDTTVSGGTLTLGQINASNEASTVSIASGAVLNLTFGGTDTVAKLFLDGVQQPIGVYGSGNSGGLITGTGTLTVSPASGYSSWITGFGLAPADQDPTDDPENDGMNNLLEFVLNGNPSLSDNSILPTLVVTATDFEFTYQRRDDSVSPETTQTFQWGTTLATWPGSAVIPATSGMAGMATITVSPGIPSDAVTDTVKISIPKTEADASGKLFGRLQVVK